MVQGGSVKGAVVCPYKYGRDGGGVDETLSSLTPTSSTPTGGKTQRPLVWGRGRGGSSLQIDSNSSRDPHDQISAY